MTPPPSPDTATPPISHEQQQEITRLCIHAALLLLQYGAESTLIDQIAFRLGRALGMDSVECALTPNAIVITTLCNNHCITTTRKNFDKGINMSVITVVQHIVIAAEQGLYDVHQVRALLDAVKPVKYNRYLVVLMVGLSCASFAHLSGGDPLICGITFVASACGMWVRQMLSARQYNPAVVFAVTAFVASMVSGMALKYGWGARPEVAMASSVLLLVPGVPLINSLADILKGHVNMGMSRWAVATVLTFSTCLGIVLALSLLNVSAWE
ncbi:threonine/serine exporter family protein [Eikenella sp. S3360]|uniref:Threonine/serine exporter family protein n=1 Tax=Eikenella glucosivorans TaxID=2766967 RepID=A0ABS0N8A4_9NEIS|nr:threonine/serine exporter ThrE family protein [Eikenella glucosivorans]MBH5328501.1 threonine/serine exporter family protein [Eikenella glucosivorans]